MVWRRSGALVYITLQDTNKNPSYLSFPPPGELSKDTPFPFMFSPDGGVVLLAEMSYFLVGEIKP